MTPPSPLTELAERPRRRRWKLLGVEVHAKWRSGKTWLDNAGGDHLLVHHGLWSAEWARGSRLDYYKQLRRARAASENSHDR